MKNLTEEQRDQEDLYSFPYHYLDLKSDEHRLLLRIEGIAKLRLIRDYILKNNFKRILDAGCGDARLFHEIKDFNGELVGVDYSERAIGFAKVFNPHAEFYCQRLEELNVEGLYDCILLIDILEHIVPEQVPKVLSALHNNLNDGGVVLIDVPTTKTPLEPKHYQHFSKEALSDTLKPFFVIEGISGRNKAGSRRKIFNALRRLGNLLYPLRGKLRLTCFFDFLTAYYNKHLVAGEPDECYNMVVICKKNKASAFENNTLNA